MDEPDDQKSILKDIEIKIDSSPVKNNRMKTSEVICIEDSPVKAKAEPPPKPAEPEVHTRIIGGVSIIFPVKPYGAQIAVMDKVIKGITKSQNCLLESPTGSGKTLALLCSALAWQKKRKDEVSAKLLEKYKSLHESPQKPSRAKSKQRSTKNFKEDILQKEKKSNPKSVKKCIYLDSDDDDELFKVGPSTKKKQDVSPVKSLDGDVNLVKIHKRQKMSTSFDNDEDSQTKSKFQEFIDDDLSDQKRFDKPEDDSNCQIEDNLIPKIYFGTRTHKQLEQIIKELKKTVYAKNLKISILSSREHTCIKTLMPSYKNKTDMCRELLDRKKTVIDSNGQRCTGCKHFDQKQILVSRGSKLVWDIEEFVKLGYQYGACAYFAARDIAINADIVFCPYNYIIDPLIRSSTSIEVENNIIILDEAHNIEDVCRESASLTFELKSIDAAIGDLDDLLKLDEHFINHNFSDLSSLRVHLKNWHDWFENHEPLIQKKSNFESEYTMKGKDFTQSLNNHNIGHREFSGFVNLTKNILTDVKERFEPKETEEVKAFKKTVSTATSVLLESIAIIFSFVFRDKCVYLDDYISILVKKEEFEYRSSSQWLSKTSQKKTNSGSTMSLSVKCLNPAIVFNSISQNARSVILCSGTLTPITSFPIELSAEFPITVQTNHVISADQVWVGSVGFGPNDIKMEATYANTSRVQWQDSLGQMLLWVCKNVPNGVLCFLSSYRLLDTLSNRWRTTGMWDEIENEKSIFTESKNMREHGEIMTEYYACVDNDGGGLLFAVYRGKVSEGMDFRDHQARAVITVGIPYPNVKDSLVDNKMKYNDAFRTLKGLMSGRDWLQIQAYRALNQAVGRCIRHKDDWGAIIMVDSRFENSYYTNHISKWVRNYLGSNHNNWNSLTAGPNNLRMFMNRMMKQ